jgi:glutamine amidotransferase
MENKYIAVVDYGVGNVGSILNMLKKLGVLVKFTKDIETIRNASKIILPGVGSFDYGMNNLESSNLIDVLNETTFIRRTPILGICLGAQLMTNSSEEGIKKGLGWFNAEVKKFVFSKNSELKVPHMGWSFVNVIKQNILTNNLYSDSRFYFVHSYYISSFISEDVMFKTYYGFDFVSGLQKDNIYAVQFHPEKSHKYGLKLIQNFISI